MVELQVTLKAKSKHNAVLRYEEDFTPATTQKTVTKTRFDPVFTEPAFDQLFHKSDALNAFCHENVSSTARDIVLFTDEGIAMRNKIKKEIEDEVTKKTCITCCLTCGLALCIAGCCDPCGATDLGEKKLNEDYYCEELQQRYPDKTATQTYSFTLAKGE